MKQRAPRNRTLSCDEGELRRLAREVMQVSTKVEQRDIECRVVAGDIFEVAKNLPEDFVDLLILDPPYNLSKIFNGNSFRKKNSNEYGAWFEKIISLTKPLMKQDSTLYVCSDWRTSTLVFPILEKHFFVRNRITWEREKGRGAKENWKNNTEDIWFCTKSDRYYFDVESVKILRRVLAPYRVDGNPKDWFRSKDENFRHSYPSNIWTDLTVPFWSMPENTDHPTQKPEKLIAKLILASSRKGDFVFDPFLGSGTTAVVAKKLQRLWCGVDTEIEYLCWALKRIANAENDPTIQGYEGGIFWERNTFAARNKSDSSSRERPVG